jgi:hypothetical protein
MTKEEKDKKQIELVTAICLGNQSAVSFCQLWVQYCDEIDNLIDTVEDGRPIFTKEHILRVFVMAIEVYNHPFFVLHRDMLKMVAVLVTNTYTDSVLWERDPLESRRRMADTLRFCGNDMIFAISTICGGYNHTRKISQIIRDGDWSYHHDEKGRPH